MIFIFSFLSFWSLYDLPIFRLPEIKDTQEFITGKWNLELKNYFPNGNQDGKPRYFSLTSYRKNVGDSVYISVYNQTKQGSKKILNKYEILFLNQEKDEAKAFLVDGDNKIELAHVNINIEKDSTRSMRGKYENSNFSLYLYPSNTARLTFVEEGSQYITNIQFERETPEGQQENPMKWFSIVGLIGMFAIIGYMISLPDEKPTIQENQINQEQNKEATNENSENNEEHNEIESNKENNDEITKRKSSNKEELTK